MDLPMLLIVLAVLVVLVIVVVVVRVVWQRGAITVPAATSNSSAIVGTVTGSDLVPLFHPLVVRAAERALEQSKRPDRPSVVRQGDQLFLNLTVIEDASERARARELFERLANGGEVPIGELTRIVQHIL